jgi:acyl-CoA synthetase (NDP forming)
MIASAVGADYARAIAAVGADPSIDSVVAIYVPPLVTGADEVAAGIARGAAAVPASKPVATVFLSSRGTPDVLGAGARGRLPSFSFPENAARALAAAARHGRWRDRPPGRAFVLPEDAVARIRSIVAADRGTTGEARWLGAAAVEAVLDAAGIPSAASRVVSAASAPEAARAIGYPVVLKGLATGLVHKS